jgi:hypothetical protein
LQKSKEQLEEEKRAILAQRIQALAIDGLKSDGLIQKAKELHEKLHKLMGEQYDTIVLSKQNHLIISL